MPRKLTKSIAVVVQIVLAITLAAILSLLVGLIRGDPAFLKWIYAQPWYSLWNLAWATIAIIVLMIAVAFWQRFSSNGRKDQPATREDLEAATRRMLEGFQESARQQGLIPAQTDQARDAEITRLTGELRKLQEQVAARSSELPEAQLSKLLEARDLDGALRLKSQQVQDRRGEVAKLPRDLFELGVIHELRFEWSQALAAYREAWELGKDPDHGFQYAVFAQKLNHFKEAIAAYEPLLLIYVDPPDRADTLNNLGLLYYDTQRLQEAEEAYGEALSTYRKLAEANPDAWLSYVATTLNNIADLYSGTQRMKEAEEAYAEALAINRKLAEANPDVYLSGIAMTLNNLAILYRATQRLQEAEEAYGEALSTYRKLAEANPDAWLSYVATTLNNIADLYSGTQRMKEAEEAYAEALAIRRNLAEANPDAYLPGVATTLKNIADLYSDTQRIQQAEQAYTEALAIRRNLAEANPDAYLPYVAMTLNNLADLYCLTGRTQEAETHAAEAEGILDPLWQANPELHGNLMARILGTRAEVCEASKKPAAEACTLARRALAAAYDPALKQAIQQHIDRHCPESQG
jgi:tetratricopeptide (TPR) repeat protein